MKSLPQWAWCAITTMMLLLIVYLCLALRLSRENERELSRRMYQTERQAKQ